MGHTGGQNGPSRPQNGLKTHLPAPQVVWGHLLEKKKSTYFWTSVWWAGAGQNTPKHDQTGTWRAKPGSSGAFGPICAVQTTKCGGWHGGKVPSESRLASSKQLPPPDHRRAQNDPMNETPCWGFIAPRMGLGAPNNHFWPQDACLPPAQTGPRACSKRAKNGPQAPKTGLHGSETSTGRV